MVADSHARSSKEALRKELRPLRAQVDSATEKIVVNHLADFLGQIDGVFLFYRSMPNELQLDSLPDRLGWEKFATTRTPKSGPLTVHSASGIMERHKFGYMQPLEDRQLGRRGLLPSPQRLPPEFLRVLSRLDYLEEEFLK